MCSRPHIDETTDQGAVLSPGRLAERELWELELERRRIESRIAGVLARAEQSGTYSEDGHLSVRGWATAITSWSNTETTARVRTARALAELTETAACFAAGNVGVAQVFTLARLHANPRTRADLPGSESLLLEQACSLPYSDFELVLQHWRQLADADGTRQRHEDTHTLRHAHLSDVGDETVLNAGCGTANGAVLHEIFEAFCEAEFTRDSEQAAPGGALPRTAAQRRFDALYAIFLAAAEGGQGGSLNLVVNYVADATTYDDELRRMCGGAVRRRDPATVMDHRCSTLRGSGVSPADVLAAGLVGSVRRVVIGADSLPIDLGRRRRFTGAARHALLLTGRHCAFPGCHVPASRCEGDHIVEHSRGGRTNPGNGDLLCPPHNRLKNRGYRTVRDPAGGWRTFRPDGSEVARPTPVSRQ